MKPSMLRALLVSIALLPATAHAQTVLQQILGAPAVTFDSAKLTEVKNGTPGARHWYDTNADGKIDEVWFVDTDPRHTGAYAPLVVKIIDRDGDLAIGKEGDHDSDLWVIDRYGNGTADVAIEYDDYDHDNDMDMMAEIPSSGSGVLWAYDVDDDNLLWYEQDYGYVQTPCQDHCHYDGERTSILTFDTTNKVWVPSWESPFFFIDVDKDGINDEVVRVTVNPADTVATLRWSFNVNGDGTDDDPRNYDCSISAFPLPNTKIQGTVATSTTLHGYPINSMLSYEQGTPWLRGLTWQSGCFTWVENDNNVGWNDTYTAERWEGVIVYPSAYFGKIGSPYCGPYNNRNEVDLSPAGPFAYYYNPSDHRIHLKSADQAWIDVDWNGTFSTDMRYTWVDTNADGLLDQIRLDVDASGSIDDTWTIATNSIQNLVYDWRTFKDAYAPVLRDYPAQLYELDRALAAALESVQPGSSDDAIWTLVQNKFSLASLPVWKQQKFLNSDIAMIYYLELVRDRQIIKLKSLTSSSAPFWIWFNDARSAGATEVMSYYLRQSFAVTPTWPTYSTWVADLRKQDVKRVNASEPYVWRPGIAWETEKAAWRVVAGQFDFLGKRQKRLVLDELTTATAISTDTGGWGMDALLQGTGPGAGGLTLYINGTAYPLYGMPLYIDYSIVEQTNDKVTVQMMINSVGPASAKRSVRIRATALAGRDDTQLEALIHGGPASDKLELGIGFTRPAEAYYEHRPNAGILGIWGFQDPSIDWIGMGVIYRPSDFSRLVQSSTELDVILNVSPDKYVDWTIKNDWRRGRRFSNFPVLANWMKELTKTAQSTTFPDHSATTAEWLKE